MTDELVVTGIEIQGKHGVFDFEKNEPQSFVVDLVMRIDSAKAAEHDRLSDTADYGLIVADVAEIIEGPGVNLIETLAERIAEAVLREKLVHSVKVTVHKPQAPIVQPFGDVWITIERGRDA